MDNFRTTVLISYGSVHGGFDDSFKTSPALNDTWT